MKFKTYISREITLLFLLLIIIYIVLLVFYKQIVSNYGLGINFSKSEQPGIYIRWPITRPLKINDLVSFALTESQSKTNNYHFNRELLLIKHIGAIPGDWLFTLSNSVYACSKNNFSQTCKFLGQCLKFNSNNTPLTCQQWDKYKIPVNKYYLQSNRIKNSFDSRYFGLIDIKNIKSFIKIIISL